MSSRCVVALLVLGAGGCEIPPIRALPDAVSKDLAAPSDIQTEASVDALDAPDPFDAPDRPDASDVTDTPPLDGMPTTDVPGVDRSSGMDVFEDSMIDASAPRDATDAGDVAVTDAGDATGFIDVTDAFDVAVMADVAVVADVADVVDVARDVVAVDVCPVCALAHSESICRDGACAIARCVAGYVDCDGRAEDGCERAVSPTAPCMGCDAACGAGGACLGGACVRQRSCPDGSERGCGLVSVTGGTFTMGESSPVETYFSPPQPLISVSDFAVDAYEVTVARFRRFWAAGHPLPGSTVRYPGGVVPWLGPLNEPLSTSECTWSTAPGSREQHPLTCVLWWTAQAFCVWEGGRLPTEAEWEFVARGRSLPGLPIPRRYPWGNERPSISPVCDRAQVDTCLGDDGVESRRVGSFPGVAGVFDLLGNVEELTADHITLYSNPMCWGGSPMGRFNPICVLPGAPGFSVRDTREGVLFRRSASRRPDGGMFPNEYLGFRCVR